MRASQLSPISLLITQYTRLSVHFLKRDDKKRIVNNCHFFNPNEIRNVLIEMVNWQKVPFVASPTYHVVFAIKSLRFVVPHRFIALLW